MLPAVRAVLVQWNTDMTSHIQPNYPLSYLSASQKWLPVMQVGDRARKETDG